MGRWFNSAAVEWVIFESPPGIPAGAKWTYAVVALHARATGRSAYPSVDVIAKLTGRSERQVRRDLDDLGERSLLLPGDPKTVAHLRADRRPDVWDLPEGAREYIGRHRKQESASPRGDTMAPRTTGHGVTPLGSRGDKNAVNGVPWCPPRGDTMAPEEFFEENSEKGTAPSAVGGTAAAAPETRNPAMVALAAEAAHCADPRCRGSRFPVDPETGMHDECKGFARFRAVRTR